MKNVKIKYNQLKFLYAYLRLIDLSLDRSRWGEWNNFLLYFKNILSPTIVIKYLKENFDLTEQDVYQVTVLSEQKTVIDKLKAFAFNASSIRRDDVLYCCKILLDFDKILKSDHEDYNFHIEQLRENIAKYYTEVLGRFIASKDLKILMRIEHFNKSDNTDVVKLDDFIPIGFSLDYPSDSGL